jgi:hypothetical protein
MALPVLKEQVDDKVTVYAVGREAKKHTQITDCPNNVTEASVHRASGAAAG